MSAIASFYAQMSFQVDSSGLVAFRKEMELTKKEMGGTLALVAATAKALKSMLSSFGKMQNTFDAKSMQSWRKSIAAAARAYVKVMEASNGVLHQVAQEASKSQIKLSNFEKRLNSNIVALNSYAHALLPVVLLLERLRGAAGSPLPRVGGGFRGGGNGAGNGNGGHGGAGRPPSGAGAGLLETAGIMAFLKPMLPMGMGLGGMLGGGYAFRELIGAGREMFAMELKMKAVSKSSEAFANNMKYVRELSQQLGLDLVGAGNAYAQIVVTAQEKMNPEQMQKMFTGFNKYYATVHMTTEDQRLANLAIQQMFGKDKIQAQEARLQMGQRVTPFIKLLTEAAKEKMGAKFTTFDDVMKRGLLDPAELLPIVADKLTIIANTGGALAEALENSQVAQVRFNNSLKEFSYIVMKGGLDHALAVMFAYGSEAVPMVAKAFKGLMHTVKNLFDFLTEGLLTLKTLFATTIAAAVVGMTFLFTSTFTQFAAAATFAEAAWLRLSLTMTRVGAILTGTLAPLALFIAGAMAVSDMVDLLQGGNPEDSWLVTLVAIVDFVLSSISLKIAELSLALTQALAMLHLLPSNMDYDDKGNATPNGGVFKEYPTLELGKPTGSRAIEAMSKVGNYLWDKAYYGGQSQQQAPVQQVSVQVNLPQMTPQQAAILQTGDMSLFGEAMGQAASKEFRFYNPSTH